MLDIARSLEPPAFLSVSDRPAQKSWLSSRIQGIGRIRLPQLNDGHRLPGREGKTIPASVLIPIVNRPDGLTMLLTQRSDTLPDHPGQVSFPGGRAEDYDDGPADTALRESDEEIGLDRTRVEILGEVGRYETVTGYSVTPVAGWVEPPFTVSLDPVEVAEIFEVPLTFVLDPANYVQNQREVNGRVRHFFSCSYGERYIWGATAAMILMFYYALAAPLDN